jgi:hypothetical protein
VAVVGQPPTVENVVETIEQSAAIAEIRPSDMERLGKRGRAAEDRQVSD